MEIQKPVVSVGGIIYIFDPSGEPRFLIIKRYARSKKIERIAPKGKMEEHESPTLSCAREINEETGLSITDLVIKQELGRVELKHQTTHHGLYEKSIIYFLVEYIGPLSAVKIEDAEGFIGVYKRASIGDIMGLVYYENLRNIYRSAYDMIAKSKAKQALINSIM